MMEQLKLQQGGIVAIKGLNFISPAMLPMMAVRRLRENKRQ
jgi:hypothetical protein